MADGTLELPNILSLAQSLRGDDIYGKQGNHPKSMITLSKGKRNEMSQFYTRNKNTQKKCSYVH